jgi:hypothetical protein
MDVKMKIKYDNMNNVKRNVILNIKKNESEEGLFGNDNKSIKIKWLKKDNVKRNKFII